MTPVRALLVAALVLAGCLEYGGEGVGSGIVGVATMGPTCPVERDPPDPACADRPYEGELVASRVDGGVSGTFRTDAEGRFNVSLPAGAYEIRSPEGQQLPWCAGGPVEVVAGAWTRVDVSCDTGIR